MASRNRLLNRFYRNLLGTAFPVAVWSCRHLPARVLDLAIRAIIATFMLLRPKYGRAVRSNYARILDASQDSPRVRALARRMMLNHMRYWAEFFYWSGRGAEAARAAILEVRNQQALDGCIASGRGCLVLTAHLGNWEMGGLLLEDRAREVAVVYVPDRFEVIESYRSRYRRLARVTEIPIGDNAFSALPVIRVLRSGGVVAVQGDRDFDDSGVPVPFFGKPARFPRGPVVLAMMAKVPILPVFILQSEEKSRGGFRIVFFDPIEPQGDPRDLPAVDAVVARIAATIESIVREAPAQWYCFYPFWEDTAAIPPAADQSRRVAPTAAT